MFIQAKKSITRDFGNKISVFLSYEDTQKVLQLLDDVLVDYEISMSFGKDRNKELLKMFLEAKELEGRSSKTINRYSYILEKMLQSIQTPIEKISVFDLRAYLLDEKTRGLSDQSLEGVRSIMSCFFGWLFNEGLIRVNPMANVGSIKCKKQIKKPFTVLELETIKESCISLREKAIIHFLLSTGCRINEVCLLNKDAIDFKERECKVLGKGNKERIVYLDEISCSIVKRYLDNRNDDDPALFVGIRGRLNPQGVRALLKRIEARSGVVNVHPHRFRRTLATNLIDKGMPIQEVAFVLGHENINTTMKYVYINKKNVKNSYQKYA